MSYLTNFRNEDAGALFGSFRGATCFLVCGGPSLNTLDLSPLNQRGVLVAAVNNVAATHVRPQLWFSFDDPAHFVESIWQDPGIAKFVREDRLGLRINKRSESGDFVAGDRVRDCPNVWGYKCENGWKPEHFLASRFPTGGTEGADQDPDGRAFNKSVLLPALRILFDLGVRRVYLLGADFHMSPTEPYAFAEACDPTRAELNNQLFAWLDRRFREIRPFLDREKFKVWNATPGSKLTAFETVDYNDIVKREAKRVDQHPATRGHYQ
jgi:hypothetical protein